MEITTHGLKKPDGDDFYNIQDHNDNTDIIEQHLSDTDIHVNSQEIAQITEVENLAQIDESDTNSSMWGKVKKVISTLITHISSVATGSTLGHIKIGTGLQMNSGTASVKLTDSISTDDSTMALSAAGGKKINDSLNGFTIITHPNQINMLSPTSIEDVINAMPLISSAMFSISPSFPEYQALLPYILGLLEITKYDERRTRLFFTGVNQKFYMATYHADIGFSGWRQIGGSMQGDNEQVWTTAELQSNAIKAFDWASYSFLVIGTGQFNNVQSEITVPVYYFNSTAFDRRVILTLGGSTIEVYKASSNTIKIISAGVLANQTLRIWSY